MTTPELITALNQANFRAFPQTKKDGEFLGSAAEVKRCTLIVSGDSGKDYFLSRASVGINDDGTAKYQWVRGAELQSQEAKTA